jgi:TPR repeat protein
MNFYLKHRVICDSNKEKEIFKSIYELAIQGNIEKQHELAQLYWYGNCDKKNIKEEIYWITKSANNGHPRSEFYLGSYYDVGLQKDKKMLIISNIKKAIYW